MTPGVAAAARSRTTPAECRIPQGVQPRRERAEVIDRLSQAIRHPNGVNTMGAAVILATPRPATASRMGDAPNEQIPHGRSVFVVEASEGSLGRRCDLGGQQPRLQMPLSLDPNQYATCLGVELPNAARDVATIWLLLSIFDHLPARVARATGLASHPMTDPPTAAPLL